MKVLVSAFACAPNVGSEGGVGWRWALELAKTQEVIVITDTSRRAAIESESSGRPSNLQFIYYRPSMLAGIPLNSITAQILYGLWQIGLLRKARVLHGREGFDWCLHLTYGVFRQPSFLGYLGIPFIFGPLGGGEDSPWRLKKSIRGAERVKELARYLLNRLAAVDPVLRAALRRATLIVVRTEETRHALPRAFRGDAVVFQEVGIDVRPMQEIDCRDASTPLKVLFVGRLLGWKGVHLAIRAVAQAVTRGLNIEFTVVGDGPSRDSLMALASAEGISNRVRWISRIPQDQLFDLYDEMHCFLFPSLHDSGGNVVLEAQAASLPIVCLDLGGPKTLVSPESAFVIPTRGKSENEIVANLSGSLTVLCNEEDTRLRMGRAARQHACGLSWSSRVEQFLKVVEDRVLVPANTRITR